MRFPTWLTKQTVSDPLQIKGYMEDFPSLTPIEQIRQRMRKLRMSVHDLAHVLGMSPPRVHALLHSFQNMNILTLMRLAAGVGLQLDIQLSPISRRLPRESKRTQVEYNVRKPNKVTRGRRPTNLKMLRGGKKS